MNTSLRNIQAICLFFFLTTSVLPLRVHAQIFPAINTVIMDSSATEGYYFMSPYKNSPPYTCDRPLMILDKYGRMIFYRYFPGPLSENVTIDFKIQKDGRMTYFNNTDVKFFIMDSTFTVVDSIICVNGFETDQHDIQILPNHHILLLGLETRIMNLSSYHWFGINHNQPGGTNAQVLGVVIQEFDENKNLVWEWKGHDHYQFADVNQIWLSLPNKVDWTHANSVEMDQDGNILLCLRHFDEITKINHTNGNIIWRMGGKANQFTFPNDTIGFTGQHDIRRVSDTSISIFDNGQYTNPVMARALEYALDENNKIARLVWEYIYDSTMFSAACGNHQYIGNGNHLVDFGFSGVAYPWMVVVKQDKSEVLEFKMPNGYVSYRSFNYPTLPWQLNRPNVECRKTGENYYLVAEPGHPEYKWSTGATTDSIQVIAPGDYWVFVPYGEGYLSSEHITITDISTFCVNTSVPPAIIPSELSFTCMPNPATDKLRIMVGLPDYSNIVVSLENMLGAEIQRPMNGFYPAGNHEVTLNVSALKRGIYLLSLTTNKTRIIRKVIVQ